MRDGVLVTGAGGFIGQALVRAGAGGAPHGLADPPSGTACLVHAGRHPSLGTPAWRIEDDVEPRLALACARAGVPFVSLGSRKATTPADAYGYQKAAIEARLRAVPDLRLTVLRLGNVFGFEPGRRSFMGAMLDGLRRDGTIRFDMSPFTRRDFLPVSDAARMILAVAAVAPSGTFPLGSGVALDCGRLALAVIRGFGRGRLVCESPDERDGFVLDPDPLRALGIEPPNGVAILAEAEALGRCLRDQEARSARRQSR
ncbi:MAG: NAD(P)-dependent oxidoreductase [Geminicoccaceae bacterium]|nr:NAD(P)-dependent oxidoreductase [Geminicoccaceae bacterium]